ncbi:hypothetical protein LUZ60_002962 [Juncus effusus]|nr:hypothetical protein LUZ60_002962 [Juncus effusus]
MEMTLGAVTETIINTLAEFVKDKAASVLGLEEELERLNCRLNFVQGILTDAESHCSVDSIVTAWLSQVRDFMYCAEDVIESCKFESQKILEHSNSVYIKPDFGYINVERRGSCSLMEPDIVGKEIEYATNDLRGMILRDKEPRIRAYAIIGMGGIGKTTLAQKIVFYGVMISFDLGWLKGSSESKEI